jgi:hypothetical protein
MVASLSANVRIRRSGRDNRQMPKNPPSGGRHLRVSPSHEWRARNDGRLNRHQRLVERDFSQRARGLFGFSPDRVDALVWALTDLLVEPMRAEGHFEYMRQRAAALKPPAPEPVKPVYAIGSMEWAAQQQAEKGE